MASDDKVQELLNEAWRSAYMEAEKKFSELTKKYLKNARSKDGKILLQKNTKFEDLQGQVNSVRFSVREDRERHSKWTQPLLNACRPIERFGGAVSGIVSAVSTTVLRRFSLVTDVESRHFQRHRKDS
jgi:hypothetical protein